MTGPNPVDRGKAGSKIHVLSDRAGLPLMSSCQATCCAGFTSSSSLTSWLSS
jgi:hypothetical protein